MNRRELLSAGAVGLTLLTGTGGAARAKSIEFKNLNNETAEGNGVVTVDREESYETVVNGIQSTIEKNEKLTLVTTLDHAKNADSIGLDLCPTTVIMFGNPALGTPLMQEQRTIGIDLPQKMLVWEADGVHVSYNDPNHLADRHGIEDSEILTKIASALEKIATGNTGP